MWRWASRRPCWPTPLPTPSKAASRPSRSIRSDPHQPLRPAAVLDRDRARVCGAGRAADPAGQRHCPHRRRRQADHRALSDLTRISLYVLLPFSIVIALAYVALGEPQTLLANAIAHTVEGGKQTIALYPI